MGRKGRERPEKRQRELAKQQRATEKAARKQELAEEAVPAADDPAVLMEEFRVLSEGHAAGAVDAKTFAQRRSEIFESLGLGTDDE